MKNHLKLTLLLAGAVVLAAPVLRAEDTAAPAAARPERGPGRHGPAAMMERAAKELGLSADQEAKWKEIGAQERAALEPIFKDKSLSREDRRAKMKELHQGYADQRRAVLTEEQQKKFDDMQARMRERMERGPKKDQ